MAMSCLLQREKSHGHHPAQHRISSLRLLAAPINWGFPERTTTSSCPGFLRQMVYDLDTVRRTAFKWSRNMKTDTEVLSSDTNRCWEAAEGWELLRDSHKVPLQDLAQS